MSALCSLMATRSEKSALPTSHTTAVANSDRSGHRHEASISAVVTFAGSEGVVGTEVGEGVLMPDRLFKLPRRLRRLGRCGGRFFRPGDQVAAGGAGIFVIF